MRSSRKEAGIPITPSLYNLSNKPDNSLLAARDIYHKYIVVDGNSEVINFHKPHSNGILKRYVLDQVIEKLRKDGLI